MRHVLSSHAAGQARRAGRRRGWADRTVRVPRDRWVSRSATSTAAIRNHRSTSIPVFRQECANSSHSPMVGNEINVAQTKRVSLDELDLKTDRWEFVTYFGMQASELDTAIDFISLSCIVS